MTSNTSAQKTKKANRVLNRTTPASHEMKHDLHIKLKKSPSPNSARSPIFISSEVYLESSSQPGTRPTNFTELSPNPEPNDCVQNCTQNTAPKPEPDPFIALCIAQDARKPFKSKPGREKNNAVDRLLCFHKKKKKKYGKQLQTVSILKRK